MKIIHSFDKFRAEKNIKGDASFILTNKLGGYCYLANNPISRYQGVFFNNNFGMLKVIEDIKLDAPSIRELKNNFYNIDRKRSNIIESFFMPYNHNSIVYELNKTALLELILDIRESYSHPASGRFYEIFEENNRIIIKYRQANEFECYLVVSGYLSYEKTQQWFKQFYELDKQRNSFPYEKYVFSALRINSKKLTISFSFDKETAVKENCMIANNLDMLKNKQKNYIRNIINKNQRLLTMTKDKELRLAYICALTSLDNLIANINKDIGIYAGLPWFFQFWSRDEAVSLEALKYSEKRLVIRKILSRFIDNIKENKILNRYPNGDTYSIDAIGWLMKRITSINKSLLKDKTVLGLLKNLDDNLVLNNKNETWMDSLNRDNARIEVQALKLFMLKLANDKEQEKRLKEKLRENFWNGFCLKDGINDDTIRPNLFIANYIYPELLTNEEWLTCFKYALKRLWLNWGGVSTIDRNSNLFCPKHSGELPISYHNGDSWFWINNLTAIVFYRTHKQKFKGYIKKILNASKNEILWKGAISHHAELSSASGLNSEGCLMQAWSAAMFIELVNKLVSDKT